MGRNIITQYANDPYSINQIFYSFYLIETLYYLSDMTLVHIIEFLRRVKLIVWLYFWFWIKP